MSPALPTILAADAVLLLTLPVQPWIVSPIAAAALLICHAGNRRTPSPHAWTLALLGLTALLLCFGNRAFLRVLGADPPAQIIALSLVAVSIAADLFGRSRRERLLPTYFIISVVFGAIFNEILSAVHWGGTEYGMYWWIYPWNAWTDGVSFWAQESPFIAAAELEPNLAPLMAATLAAALICPLNRRYSAPDLKKLRSGSVVFLAIIAVSAPIRFLWATYGGPHSDGETGFESGHAAMARAVDMRRLGWWPGERSQIIAAAEFFIRSGAPSPAVAGLTRLFNAEPDNPEARTLLAAAVAAKGDRFFPTALLDRSEIGAEELAAVKARMPEQALVIAEALAYRDAVDAARKFLHTWVDGIAGNPAALDAYGEGIRPTAVNRKILEFAGRLAIQADDDAYVMKIIERFRKVDRLDPSGRYLEGSYYFDAFEAEAAYGPLAGAFNRDAGNAKFTRKLADFFAWHGDEAPLAEIMRNILIYRKPDSWRGKQGWNLVLPGEALMMEELGRGNYELRVQAWGTSFQGEGPGLTIRVNGMAIGQGVVKGEKSLNVFAAPFWAHDGLNRLSISFDNDAAGPDGDRNLALVEATIYPVYAEGEYR